MRLSGARTIIPTNVDLRLGDRGRTRIGVDAFSGTGYSGTGSSVQNPPFDTNVAVLGRLLIAPVNTNGELPSPAFGEPLAIGIRGKTFTDNQSSGTISSALAFIQIDQNTLAASTATTYGDVITLNLNAPAAGGNVTFTRSWAMWLDGNLNIDASQNVDYADVNKAAFHTGGGISANKSIWTREVLALSEMTAPSSQANVAKIFAQDNGAGKTQLMAQFGSGAAQQIAIEP